MTKRIAGIKVIDKKNMRKRSQEVLSMMDIHIDPKTSVAALNATAETSDDIAFLKANKDALPKKSVWMYF